MPIDPDPEEFDEDEAEAEFDGEYPTDGRFLKTIPSDVRVQLFYVEIEDGEAA